MIEKEYLASRVATANDAQLVALLYEGLMDSLKDSIECINNNEEDNLNKNIDKCKEILAEFLATLKGDSDVANNYRSLYLYINRLISMAHVKKDVGKLKDAIKVVTPLYEAWNELGISIAKEEIVKNKPAIVSGMTYGKGYVNDYVVNEKNRWEKG